MLHAASTEPLVLYLWHAELWHYVRHVAADVVVFHVFDIMDAHVNPSAANGRPAADFRQACRVADLVVTGTEEQAEIAGKRKAVVVPNGVPFDWYAADAVEPEDLRGIPRPRIGYVGTLSHKVDAAWLERLSQKREWQIVLAGHLRSLNGRDHAELKRLFARPNVHYLGAKKADEVPAYIRGLDVGLMCYRRGLHCELASPLKLYEYAAAGIPMVASRLGSLARNADVASLVRFADTPEEAYGRVRDALLRSGRVKDRETRIDFARRNSWDERARRIVE